MAVPRLSKAECVGLEVYFLNCEWDSPCLGKGVIAVWWPGTDLYEIRVLGETVSISCEKVYETLPEAEAAIKEAMDHLRKMNRERQEHWRKEREEEEANRWGPRFKRWLKRLLEDEEDGDKPAST